MPTKTLKQIVSYISPALRTQLEKDRKRLNPCPTVSRYVERVLHQHLSQKKGA